MQLTPKCHTFIDIIITFKCLLILNVFYDTVMDAV